MIPSADHEQAAAEQPVARFYVVVRTDIPLVNQMIAVGHACRMAGGTFGVPEYAHITLLAAQNGDALRLAYVTLPADTAYLFFEPDIMGETAFCTRAITDGFRPKALRKLKRWEQPHGV